MFHHALLSDSVDQRFIDSIVYFIQSSFMTYDLLLNDKDTFDCFKATYQIDWENLKIVNISLNFIII